MDQTTFDNLKSQIRISEEKQICDILKECDEVTQ